MPLLVAEMVKMLRANAKAEFTGSGLGGVMLARFGEISEKQREFLRVLSVFTCLLYTSILHRFDIFWKQAFAH